MDEKQKRGRFRFTLRSLFVIVTLVAVWLGWSLNWIRQRREFLRDDHAWRVGESIRAPALLWLLGEDGVEEVWLIGEKLAAKDEARRLFPEAAIRSGYIITKPTLKDWYGP
jgi:hypothetical protein